MVKFEREEGRGEREVEDEASSVHVFLFTLSLFSIFGGRLAAWLAARWKHIVLLIPAVCLSHRAFSANPKERKKEGASGRGIELIEARFFLVSTVVKRRKKNGIWFCLILSILSF